ncbi:MAG: glycosyltransferase family 39 protein [Rhizomicrobium sp.]
MLIALRFVAGAVLPLSADEAYYWLWSKHLAAGLLRSSPAIAFLIRAGVTFFGDTSFGVRVLPLLLSIVASWFVWRAGALVFKDEGTGALACLLFNLTLMVAVETMAATPDAPLIACASAFLWALAKVDETQHGRWWLAVGLAGGLALLSKYTAFFLGAGALAWIVFVPSARRWLLSLWPYLGAVLAFAIFSPNLLWNASHHWMTFAFQFGRIGSGHFTSRFLFEFLGAQLLLATPFLFVCGVFGLVRREASSLAALILPSVAYFVIHSLHDRVQGNWPCFLYPALAVAAAGAMLFWSGRFGAAERWAARLAIPVASVLLAICYVQAFFGVLPIGRSDPFARLLAFGMPDVVQKIASQHPAAVLTTDYETASWLGFYGNIPVIQFNEPQRWFNSNIAAKPKAGKILYIAEKARDRHALLPGQAGPVLIIDRTRSGRSANQYDVYEISNWRTPALGREP